MKNILSLIALCSFIGLSGMAAAQDSKKALKNARVNTTTKKIDTSKTELDLTGDAIEGSMKTPSGEFLRSTKKTTKKNMVHLRSNFDNKLYRTRFSIQSVTH